MLISVESPREAAASASPWEAGASTSPWGAGASTSHWRIAASTPSWGAGASTPSWGAGASASPCGTTPSALPSGAAASASPWGAGRVSPACSRGLGRGDRFLHLAVHLVGRGFHLGVDLRRGRAHFGFDLVGGRFDFVHRLFQAGIPHDFLRQFTQVLGRIQDSPPGGRAYHAVHPLTNFAGSANHILRSQDHQGDHQNQKKFERSNAEYFHRCSRLSSAQHFNRSASGGSSHRSRLFSG